MGQLNEEGFRNFFTYYREKPHQKDGIAELFRRMPADLLDDQQLWVKIYRTPKRPDPATGHINQAGIDLIKTWEGLRLHAYLCPAGVWTIGYGTTKNVYPDMIVTELEAEELLARDLEVFEDAVRRCITTPLTPNEFAALVSFTYNCGEGALSTSTLRKRLNRGEDVGSVIAEEFPKWVKAGDQTLPGLVNRRNAEIALAVS